MKGIDAVMHFAGYIDVKESVENPKKYYSNNFANGVLLLDSMSKNNVKKIIFSSTAAVYGSPKKIPITEDSELSPINPYGASKLMMEKALEASGFAGISSVRLRYFNVAGAAMDGSIGEAHKPETHLIPNILLACKSGKAVNVFGTNHPTKDGTCIRDYIHVEDLVDAHVKALDPNISGAINLGTQNGFSVLEVIKACENVVGKKIMINEMPKRAGDPPILVASSKKAKKLLGWTPKNGIENIARSAWKWHAK
ncbi:MAG: UDP-glucose 4-epimerase GalE [Bacteroidetes bacterium RIFCSPHIGHO2_02_FULL_44_7]|nr:MAG: UDP-glucose 4-epimerase GalE [Bacteroidetes bacterium RIFCSPHIGHO2_02_FULL_44_7]